MPPWVPTLISIAIISLISLVGLLAIPFNVIRRHSVLFSLIALAAGTLIGDAFFHLLPEAVELWGEFTVTVSALVIAGFLAFYVIESALRVGHDHAETQHERHEPHGQPRQPTTSKAPVVPARANVAAPVTRAPSAAPVVAAGPAAIQPFGILNLVGDALHNFLDGIVVGAAFLVDQTTGIATAIAVAIHELPQEFGDFGVLLRAGFKPVKAIMFNLLSAVFAFGGAILILALPFDTETLEKYALPIVAGGFLYIAMADLVPELHHHAKGKAVPAVSLLIVAGVGLMYALTLME